MCWVRVVVLLVSFAWGACARAEEAQPTNEELFQQANTAFAQATRLRKTDPAQSHAKLNEAIAGFVRLVDERAIHSSGLHYNLANAYFLSGDLGRAVLNYKRASRMGSPTPELLRNMAEARGRVGVRVDAAKTSSIGDAILNWHRSIPVKARFVIALGAFILCWAILLLRLMKTNRPPLWGAAVCLVVSAGAGLSLWVEQSGLAAAPEAVVVADRAVGRKGPDELGYEPSFTEPLRAGVEVTILESRGNWALVRLGDKRTTWLPASSIERV